jgi:hypothetical protein
VDGNVHPLAAAAALGKGVATHATNCSREQAHRPDAEIGGFQHNRPGWAGTGRHPPRKFHRRGLGAGGSPRDLLDRKIDPLLLATVFAMDESSYRVSDAEREQAVLVLRDHLLAGRLTLEEFSERVDSTLRARVRQELRTVQQDLPDLAHRPPAPKRAKLRITAAIFSHVVRRGRLRLGRRSLVVGACCDTDLDLREATVERPTATVVVLLACGNVDVYVPEAVSVEISGLTVFGHRREWGRDVASPDAPLVRVRVLSVFGTVDLWRVPRDVGGGYRDIVRELKQRDGSPPSPAELEA